jgi:murein DD-endopeptidase MepM/ murein hydrolase activator NlpD
MSNFKVGKSRFSRFINGKGFYIALALCLVAIGAAAYIAANNSLSNISDISSSDNLTGTNTSSSDGTSWDNGGDIQTTGNTISGVPAGTGSSSSSSSSASPSSASSAPKTSSALPAPAPTIYILPLEGNIITGYSNDKLVYDKTMNDYRVHDGIDIAANQGTPVKACADGVVLDVRVDDMLGQEVIIQHGGGITSVYANLTTGIMVKKGQKLEAGDVIGAVGQTAICEIALVPHLHFAMTKNSQYVDPLITMGKK